MGFPKVVTPIFTLTMLIALAACGGGGGSNSENVDDDVTYAISVIATPSQGGIITGQGNYDEGESVTLIADPNAGYIFGNWTENGTEVSTTSSYTFEAVSDRTLTANFIPDISATNTISGSIQVAQGTLIDSDVNELNAPYTSNDDFATAQSIPNPVTLGGYINQPGEGLPGRSFVNGDPSDIYQVTLAENQTITLHIGDSGTGDLDLFLGDSGGFLIDSSEGTGVTESLIVSAAGTYLIEVYAYAGASNYVLTIGQDTGTAAINTLRVGDEFVPGDVIIQFKDVALPSASKSGVALLAQATGLTAKAGEANRPMLMHIGAGENLERAFTTLGIKDNSRRKPVLVAHRGDAHAKEKADTIRALKALRKRADVLYAEPNYIRHAEATIPDDQFYPLQWHYPLINLPLAWDIATGSGVTVAVIDTGVLLAHPDFQGRLIQGYDFISDPENALDGNGIDSNADDPGDGGQVGGSSFHGTHVAGTIAAATDNTTGVAGVAWDARIMPLRVLGMGGGTSYDILQAVRYAARLSNDSGTVPANIADIINLSLGGGGYSQAEQNTYAEARSQGVIIIAAAGNNASNIPSYPASYDGVVSVSAIDINKNLAPYSNFGDFIDVAAPGGDMSSDQNGDGYPDGVLSTVGDDSGEDLAFNYMFLQGTSMASPHVAGIVALMKSVDSDLTPAQLDNLLASGDMTADLGISGRDDLYGHGLIDAHKAVVAAQGAGATPADPTLGVSPRSLNLGTNRTTATLFVTNGGGGTLTANPPTDDAAWLTVSAASVDSNNLGTYQITIDRSGLSTGTYVATITFTSSQNTINVPVIMQVSDVNLEGDAGLQFILVVDPVTNEAVAQTSAEVSAGAYNYSITGVPAGNYQIIAGTDNNNDGFICDADEACGAYPSLDQPTSVTVDDDTLDLDFSTGFSISLSALSTSNPGKVNPGYQRIRLKHVAR